MIFWRSRAVSFKSGVKGKIKLGLENMGYKASDQMLYFSTTGIFQRRKAPNVKWLKQIRRMRRYTEPNNLVRLAVSLNKYNLCVHIPCTMDQAVD
jgi:hypothetical protein